MEREFLRNLQVNGQPLPEAVIDAIMEEHGREGPVPQGQAPQGQVPEGQVPADERGQVPQGQTPQGQVPVGQTPADQRERALKAREARLDCREYLSAKGLPSELLEVLDSSDAEKFKAAVEALLERFPAIARRDAPPPYAAGTGTGGGLPGDPFAAAFRP